MFSLLFNQMDSILLISSIQQQNKVIEQLAISLANIANDQTAKYSFWATIVLGIITLGITVYFGVQQYKISKKQHNLELFNKRWAMLEELRILGNEYFDFPHSTTSEDTTKDPNKNYYLFDNKLTLFNDKSFAIMGKKTYEELEKLRQKCMEYHQIQMEYWQVKSKLEMWDAIYAGTGSKEELQQQETSLVGKIGNTQLELYNMWSNIHTTFLHQIQNREIG